jgi:HlyD family secretion protein
MNQLNSPTKDEIENALGLGPQHQRRFWAKRLIWLVLALAALAAAYFLYQSFTTSAAVITYDTVETEKADLTVTVSATGTIQPLTQVDIGTELSGVVREVRVAENAKVKQGDVLAVLDTARLKAQRQRAVPQGDAARARLADARATFAERDDLVKRQKVLRSKGLSTDQDMEGALSGLLRAEASINAAEADIAANAADVAIIDADLDRSTIASPIDGVVLKRDVEPGQTVAASLQAPIMFVIAQDLTRIQLEAAVDEADMGAVKAGQGAAFNVDAYRGRGFPARIERLSYAPETVDGVVTYKAILSAANDDLALRPGMTATARIVVEEHPQSLVVANEALRYQPPRVAESGSWSITQIFMPRFPRSDRGRRTASTDGSRDIYVLVDGKPEKRSIKVGATDGKRTLIVSGDVKVGDAIVTAQRAQSSDAKRN